MRLLSRIGAFFTLAVLMGSGSLSARANDVSVQDARAAMDTVLAGFNTSDPAEFTKLSAHTVLVNGILTKDTPEAFDNYLKENPQTRKIFIGDVPGTSAAILQRPMLLKIAGRGIDTHVLNRVASGGVDLWLAGRIRSREDSSVIGVHAWGNDVSVDDLNGLLQDGTISQELYDQFLTKPVDGAGNRLIQATDFPPEHPYHQAFIQDLIDSGVPDAESFYLFVINAASLNDLHKMTGEEIAQYRLVRQQLFSHIPSHLMPEDQKKALSSLQGAGIGGIVNSLYTQGEDGISKTLRLISSPTANITNTVFSDMAGIQSLLDSRMVFSDRYHTDNNGEGKGLFWLDISAGEQEKDSKHSALGYKTDITGRTFGYERQLSANTVLGILFSDRKNDSTYHANGGSTVTQSYYLGLYGRFSADRYFAETGLLAGRSDSETTRNINAGLTSQKSTSDIDSEGYSLSVLGGRQFEFNQLKIAPVIGLSYSRVTVDSFTEAGSIVSVAASKTDFDSYLSKLGVRLNYPLNTAWFSGDLALNSYWLHQLGDSDRDHRVRFVQGGNRFNVSGVEGDRNIYHAQLGYKVNLTDNLSLSLDVAHIRSDDNGNNKYSLDLNYRF